MLIECCSDVFHLFLTRMSFLKSFLLDGKHFIFEERGIEKGVGKVLEWICDYRINFLVFSVEGDEYSLHVPCLQYLLSSVMKVR